MKGGGEIIEGGAGQLVFNLRVIRGDVVIV